MNQRTRSSGFSSAPLPTTSFYDRYDFEPLRNPIAEDSSASGGRTAGPKPPQSSLKNESSKSASFFSVHEKSIFQHTYSKHILLGAFLVGLIFGYDVSFSSEKLQKSVDIKDVAVVPKSRSTVELLGALSRVRRQNWNVAFKNDFGPFRGLILDKVLQAKIFVMNDMSKDRFIRRLQIKVLQSQLRQPSSFTWVTAGDSAAAAHGNMYSQSYTSVLEQTAQGAFASVGISFTARNHGMDHSSDAELSLCQEAVYGSDADVLTWDFGRSDRGDETQDRVLLWSHRAALMSQSHAPILWMHDSSERSAWAVLSQMEEHGLSPVLMDELAMGQVFTGRIPDALAPNNLKHEDVPVPIRFLTCNGFVEGSLACNEPSAHFMCETTDGALCREHKYHTQEFCPAVQETPRYQTSWNPGWKQHLFVGRLIGFALVELLNEAMLDLQKLTFVTSGTSGNHESYLAMAETLLHKLQDVEAHDVLRFQQSSLDALYGQKLQGNINKGHLLHKPAVCRTALLPAQAALVNGLRDEAVDATKLKPVKPNSAMPLVFDPSERQTCIGLNFDYRDYFVAKTGVGVTLHFPTKAECAHFSDVGGTNGMILLCPRQCSDLKCGNVLSQWDEHIKDKSLEVVVNGVPVTELALLDGCYVLMHGDSIQQQQQDPDLGIRWEKNDKDEYHIEITVHAADAELQLASIITI